jgi:hypothetical protein
LWNYFYFFKIFALIIVMSFDKHAFVSDLEKLLSSSLANVESKWEKFLAIIEQYQPTSQHCIQSIHDFDQLHNTLINLLVGDSENRSPLIDLRQFKAFELLMVDFRRLLESSLIQNTLTSTQLSIIQEDFNDFKQLVYEKEFQTLSSAVSFPLKNVLLKFFAREGVGIDPLDRSLIHGLLYDDMHHVGITQTVFDIIVNIYKRLSSDIGVPNYKDLITIINYRRIRNAQEHDFIGDYLTDCWRHDKRPGFRDLLTELNLKPLLKYRGKDMKVLEKVFDFYVTQDQYR